MMHNSKTRLLSLFLTFVMLLGVIPVPAMATGTAAGSVTLVVNDTAKDNTAVRADGATYKTVTGAYEKAVSGDTIILSTDIAESSVLMDEKELTIDFNGHVLTLSSTSYGIDVDGTAKLTLKDSSGNNSGGVKHSSTQVECILLEGAATVTIESGSYTSNLGYCVEAAGGSTGQVVINGGSFTSSSACVYNASNGAMIFLNDGTFSGNINGANYGVLLTPKVLDAVYNVNNLYNNIYIHFPTGSNKLTKDLDLHDWQLRVLEGENTTIDLNGFNITGNGMMNAPTEGGSVTITNSDSLACLIQVHETGTLTVGNSGQCDATHGRIYNIDNGANIENVWHTFRNFGNLTLNGNLKVETLVGPPNPTVDKYGDPRSSGGSCVYLNSQVTSGEPSVTLTVNEGVELHTKPTSSTARINAYAIFPCVGVDAGDHAGENAYAGAVKVTINGGKLYGETSTIQMSGTLEINGGTFTLSPSTKTECLYIGWPDANLTGISNANFVGNSKAIWIGSPAFKSDTITIHNTTINKDAGKPIDYAIAQQGEGKNVIITGKDTYWVANALTLTADYCKGTIQIRSGIFSVDPTAYVPETSGAKDYAVLDYTNTSVSNYFLVAPWTAVGTDNIVSLFYPASAKDSDTASDDVSIVALNDTESIIPDATRVQPRHFTLSSSADKDTPIVGLSVTDFKNGNRLTVQKTKACAATEAYVWYGGKSVGKIILESKNEPTYDVGGDITGATGTPTAYLIRDGVKYHATVTGTDNPYQYVVTNVPAGIYNLVVSSAPAAGSSTTKDITTTVLVEIIDHSIAQNVVLPQSVYNSVVTTDGKNTTPNVEAGGLDDMADTVGTSDAANTYVLIELKVAENESSDHADDVRAAITGDGMVKGIIMDTDVLKTVNSAPPKEITEIDPKEHGVSLITVVYHLPEKLQNKDGYAIFRYHGTQVDKITETPNLNKEYMTVNAEKDTITAHLNKFSTYSIAYTEKYTITFDANGGSVTPADAKTNAENKLDSLPTPTRSGYSFDGWYTAAKGGTKVTTATVFTGNSTIYAHWTSQGVSDNYYTITATSNAGGTISPTGSVALIENTDKTFTITPDKGFIVDDVLVDGVSVGAVASYTFKNVQKNHSINVIFKDRAGAIELDKVNHFAYMMGYPTGDFAPNRNMTRAEAIVMFSRLLLQKMDTDKNYSSNFSDISGGEWYANAVGYMERFGIISGYPDGTFGGDKPVTRAEFAAISARFDELLLDKANPFSDVASSHWAKDFIASASNKGWVSGYPDGTFKPENYITRAEVVTIVNRMLNRKADVAFVNARKDAVKFSDLQNDQDWFYYDIAEASIGHKYERSADGAELWTSIQK